MKKRQITHLLKKAAWPILVVSTLLSATCLYLENTTPSKHDLTLKIYQRKQNASKIILDKYYRPIGVEKKQFPLYIPIKTMGVLPVAFLAAEDRYFFNHLGFEWSSIFRAVVKNIRAQKYAQGGSTITQQLARMLFLNRKKSILRKLQELYIALKIERILTKQAILEVYLNQIYLGHGSYGVFTACFKYFNLPCHQLSSRQAAAIAASATAPSRFNPSHSNHLFKNKVEQIYQRMQSMGHWRDLNSHTPQGWSLNPASTVSGWLRPKPYLHFLKQLNLENTTRHLNQPFRLSTLDSARQIQATSMAHWLRDVLQTTQPAGQSVETALISLDRQTHGVETYVASFDYQLRRRDQLQYVRRPIGHLALNHLASMFLINSGLSPKASWGGQNGRHKKSLLQSLQWSFRPPIKAQSLIGYLTLSQLEGWESNSSENPSIQRHPLLHHREQLSPAEFIQRYAKLSLRNAQKELLFLSPTNIETKNQPSRSLRLSEASQLWNGTPYQSLLSHHWSLSDQGRNLWLYGSTKTSLFLIWAGKRKYGQRLFKTPEQERKIYRSLTNKIDQIWQDMPANSSKALQLHKLNRKS